MNVAVQLLWISSIPASLFVVIYGSLQPWYRSVFGWALFTSSTALAGLLDINLIYRLSQTAVLARNGVIRNCVYGYIGVGAWFMLIALLVTLSRATRPRL